MIGPARGLRGGARAAAHGRRPAASARARRSCGTSRVRRCGWWAGCPAVDDTTGRWTVSRSGTRWRGRGRGSSSGCARWAWPTTASETADRHGETWTLAKVLRRLQAHGFDHLWELERRLVRADGTAERVSVVLDRQPETGEVVGLLRSVGWDLRASEPASLERAIAGTTEFATAWDGERLIGTARSITDGGQNALIATVVVHPAYQGLGVGERMMHLLTDGRDLVRFSLAAAPGLEAVVPQAGVPAGPARDVPARAGVADPRAGVAFGHAHARPRGPAAAVSRPSPPRSPSSSPSAPALPRRPRTAPAPSSTRPSPRSPPRTSTACGGSPAPARRT